MPYIVTDRNVYLGEHTCGRHHYGDAAMVRDCCIRDALSYKGMALRNAITVEHPAYKLFSAAFAALTDAEQWIVGDIMPVYQYGPAGFVERPSQRELSL